MNFLQKNYFNKQLSNFIDRRQNEQVKLSKFDALHTVCVFATFQGEEAFKNLMQSIAYLESKNKKVSLIMYVNQPTTPAVVNNVSDICVISEKDINFAGHVKNVLYEELVRCHYDLFIDTDIVSEKSTLYLKALINAGLRTGRNQQYCDYYDLTLCVDDKYTVNEYIANLEIYISKLQGN